MEMKYIEINVENLYVGEQVIVSFLEIESVSCWATLRYLGIKIIQIS